MPPRGSRTPSRSSPPPEVPALSEPRIIVRENGSLRIEGDIPLFDAEGNRLPTPEGRPYSLCRCGRSKNKPFCDASHKEPPWDGSLGRKE